MWFLFGHEAVPSVVCSCQLSAQLGLARAQNYSVRLQYEIRLTIYSANVPTGTNIPMLPSDFSNCPLCYWPWNNMHHKNGLSGWPCSSSLSSLYLPALCSAWLSSGKKLFSKVIIRNWVESFSGQRDRSYFIVPGQRDNGTSSKSCQGPGRVGIACQNLRRDGGQEGTRFWQLSSPIPWDKTGQSRKGRSKTGKDVLKQ